MKKLIWIIVGQSTDDDRLMVWNVKAYRTREAAEKECAALTEWCKDRKLNKPFSWTSYSSKKTKLAQQTIDPDFPVCSDTGVCYTVEGLQFIEV